MNRNYIILSVIATGLAIGMLLMNKTDEPAETDPTTLAVKWNDPSRFLSVEEITHRIIQEDPGFILIDVRPADQYRSFAIPGAINIPFDSLLTASSLQLLKAPGIDKVLYSNSEVWSDQAWLLCERMKINNTFILEGGINEWFNKIVDLKEPSPVSAQEEIDNYSFRLGANQYFYGQKEKTGEDAKKEIKTTRKLPIKRNQPQPDAGGGC